MKKLVLFTAFCLIAFMSMSAQSLTGVSISKASVILDVDSVTTLSATIEPADAANKNVQWTSTDPAVATINAETGEVTAVAGGQTLAIVTTEDGEFKDSCTVYVRKAFEYTENLDSLSYSGWGKDTITGNNGFVWWVEGKGTTGFYDPQASNKLYHGNTTMFLSDTLTTGISNFSLTCMNKWNDNVPATVRLSVNGEIIDSLVTTHRTEVYLFEVSAINIPGEVVIAVDIVGGTTVVVDRLDWDGYDGPARKQYVENLDSISYSGWGKDTIVGNNGFVWWVDGKSTTGFYDPQSSNKLYHGSTRMFESAPLPTGISSFLLTGMNKWNDDVPAKIVLSVNDEIIDSLVTEHRNEVYYFEVTDINISGNVVIAVDIVGGTTVVVDNIGWDGYEAPVIPVTDVTVAPKTVELTIGETTSLSATVAPDDATNAKVTWESKNTDIASVDENGLLTAKAKGEAKIIVTTEDGSKTDECVVTVTPQTSLAKADNDILGTVFPNPFSNELIISNIDKSIQSVIIRDISGKVVLNENARGKNKIILSPTYIEVPAGVYFIQLMGVESIKTVKVIRR